MMDPRPSGRHSSLDIMATFLGTPGADLFTATAGADVFHINNTADVITGGNTQDRVVSYLADYTLTPGLGSLILATGAVSGTGNSLANILEGNAGDNILDGSAGNDQLFGGTGRDTFMFSHYGAKHADELLDFQAGIDRIALRASAFGMIAGQPFSYVEGLKATTALPTFLRQGSAGTAQVIMFDPDGTGAAKAQMLCHFSSAAGKTTASDFAIL